MGENTSHLTADQIKSRKGMPSLNDEVSTINQRATETKKEEVPKATNDFISALDTDQNLADFLENDANYLEVDMGQIDEEERPFMIVDKDTGRVYDMRNDKHVDRLTDTATTRFGT